MKISTKLLIIIGVAAATSTIVITLSGYFSTQSSIEDRVKAQLESVASLKSTQLQNLLRRDMADVVNFSKDPLIIQAINNAEKEKNPYDPKTHIGIEKFFTDRFTSESIFSELFYTDLQGRIHGSTSEKHSGLFIQDEPYFVEGLKGPYIQTLYFDRLIEAPTITISAPINDEEGNVRGILAGRVNLSSVASVLAEDTGLGTTGETYIVNRYNLIVSGIGQNNAIPTNTYNYTGQAKKCLSGASGYTNGVNYEGNPVFSVYRWNPDLKLCLLAEIGKSEALIPADNMLLITLLFGIGGLLASLIAGISMSATITKPINALRRSAQELGTGKWSEKIQVNSNDELGDLAHVFNDMAEKLLSYTKELEHKVEERTATIEENLKKISSNNDELTWLGKKLKEEKEATDKKVVERTEELRKEQARLTSSLRGLPIGLMLTDKNGNTIMTNPAIERIFNLNTADATLKNIQNEIGESSRLFDLAREVSNEKKIVTIQDIMYHARHLRVLMSPILFEEGHGEAIGTAILVEDITEAKILERSKDEFFSIASHELRTPLTAIRGNLSLIQDYYSTRIKDPEIKEIISDVQTASERLIKIVNDFLNVSRLELGTVTPNIKDFDIKTVIEESARNIKGIAAKKKLVVELHIPEDLPRVRADADRVMEILSNMLVNAVDYTKAGSITIDVMREENLIRTRVTDTGAGIAEANQSLLFHKFQQAGENILTRSVSKGTGLGLYIARLMLESMGGTIQLDASDVGKGTSFSFTLPIA